MLLREQIDKNNVYYHNGMRPVLAKYQFLQTKVLHSWTTHYQKLARTGRMPVYSFITCLSYCPTCIQLLSIFRLHAELYECFSTLYASYRFIVSLTLSQTSPCFRCLQYKLFENAVGKGEIARNEQTHLFPQCFLSIWKTLRHFCRIQHRSLQTLWIWKSQKFVVWNTQNTWNKHEFFVWIDNTCWVVYIRCTFCTVWSWSVSSEKASYFEYGTVRPNIYRLQHFCSVQLYRMI